MIISRLVACSVFLLLLSLFVQKAVGRSGLYSTAAQRDPRKLNVHIVPHAHIDSGLLVDFVQQCAVGAHPNRSAAGVHPSASGSNAAIHAMLDSVVSSLLDNPDRTFAYAELAMFISWWQQLHPDTQQAVRRLVAAGRWEFANGGIVQHDSATSHYSSMVDQMSLGMRFLQREFGTTPKVAWQLGALGHSSSEPLLKAAAGFDALYLQGTDVADQEARKARQQLELVWRGSLSFGNSSDLLASELLLPAAEAGPTEPASNAGNSGQPPPQPPLSLYNEQPRGAAAAAPTAAAAAPPGPLLFTALHDDPEAREFNMDVVIEGFVAAAEQLASYVRGSDMLLLADPDLTTTDPQLYYSSLDKLVHYVNADGRVRALYSTPSRYFAAKAAADAAAATATGGAGIGWALKTDDFLPVSLDDHGTEYQTGYFSSRPGLKAAIRRASSLLAATRQVEVLAELQPSSNRIAPPPFPVPTSSLFSTAGSSGHGAGTASAATAATAFNTSLLEFAVAVAHHQGGISGTQPSAAAAADYIRLLHEGVTAAAPKLLMGLRQLVFQPAAAVSDAAAGTAAAAGAGDAAAAGATAAAEAGDAAAGATAAAATGDAAAAGATAAAEVGDAAAGATAAAAAGDAAAAEAAAAAGAMAAADERAGAVLATVPAGSGVAQVQDLPQQQPGAQGPVADSAAAAEATAATQQGAAQSTDSKAAGAATTTATADVAAAAEAGQQQEAVATAKRRRLAQATHQVMTGTAGAVHSLPSAGAHTATPAAGHAAAAGVRAPAATPAQSFTPAELAAAVAAAHAQAAALGQHLTPAAAIAAALAAVSAADRKASARQRAAEEDDAAGADIVLPASNSSDGVFKLPQLRMCVQLHESVCASSMKLSSRGHGFLLIVYNPLSFSYSWGIRVPAANSSSYAVTGPDGAAVPAQLLPVAAALTALHPSSSSHAAQQELALVVSAPALGHAVYTIKQGPKSVATGSDNNNSSSNSSAAVASVVQQWEGSQQLLVGAEAGFHLELVLEPAAHGIAKVKHKAAGHSVSFSQSLASYDGKAAQASDATTFAAVGSPAQAAASSTTVLSGPVVQEVRQAFKDLGTLITRLWAGSEHLEVQWLLQAPPDGTNWEALLQYSTGITSGGLFYTDANGREWQQRRRGHRPSFQLYNEGQQQQQQPALGGELYPATSGFLLRDNEAELAVAIDRPQGVASPADGQLAVLLHRASGSSSGDLASCSREGLLEDPVPASGTHIISFSWASMGSSGSGSQQLLRHLHTRHHQQLLNDQLQAVFSALPGTGLRLRTTSSGLKTAAAAAAGAGSQQLGSNVHVLTLQWLSCREVLLRLSHMFQAGEHRLLSRPASVDLEQLLNLKIESAVEARLFGEQPLAAAAAASGASGRASGSSSTRRTWATTSTITKWLPKLQAASGPFYSLQRPPAHHLQPGSMLIDLNPMEIRTFYLTVQRSSGGCVDPLPPPPPPPPAPLPQSAEQARLLGAAAQEQQQAGATAAAGIADAAPAAAALGRSRSSSSSSSSSSLGGFQQAEQLLLPGGLARSRHSAAVLEAHALPPPAMHSLLLLWVGIGLLAAFGLLKVGTRLAGRRAPVAGKRAL